MNENEIGTIVVDSAVKLHKATGPGLLESVYEIILTKILRDWGLQVDRQVPIRIYYDSYVFKEGFIADIIIENKVILELKSVEVTKPVHKKQLLTYLKLTDKRVGYLLNFGAPLMKDGIFRIINGYLN